MEKKLMHPRELIVEFMNRIYKRKLTTTSGGNLSIRDSEGNIWISPTGKDKGTLVPSDICKVCPDGTIVGPFKPSCELPFHANVYKTRPDVNAVLHAHPSELVSYTLFRGVPEENFAIDPDWESAHYAPVSPKYKYQTRADLEKLIFSVHTKDYGGELCEYAFEGNDDIMARFTEYEGKLRMDVTKEPLNVVDEIFIDTARVLRGTAFACEVEVEYTMEGESTRYVMVIQMAKEDGKWLFDGPTY